MSLTPSGRTATSTHPPGRTATSLHPSGNTYVTVSAWVNCHLTASVRENLCHRPASVSCYVTPPSNGMGAPMPPPGRAVTSPPKSGITVATTPY
jgi:hypothetical protein